MSIGLSRNELGPTDSLTGGRNLCYPRREIWTLANFILLDEF